MIANFFKQSKPINFLVLILAGVLFFILSVLLYVLRDKETFSWGTTTLNFIVFLLILFLHNFITRKNNLTQNNTYALYFFVLMFAIFPKSIHQSNILLSNFFLFFAYRRIYSLRSNLETVYKIFDSGFWIGMATIFYGWSILFLILEFAAINLFRKSKWNQTFIMIIGFITPIFLYFTYLVLIDSQYKFELLWTFPTSFQYSNYNAFKLLFPISILLVFTLWAIYPTLRKSFKSKKKFKVTYYLLLLHLLIAAIIALISPIKDGSEYLFFFFPFSILFANYIQTIQDYWFKEVVLWLFLILAVSVYFFY